MIRRRADRAGTPGFTLLELLAVILILGLVTSLAFPTIGGQSRRQLRAQARQLAADLELARQRSVVTGVTHRVQIDLERARYWVEWSVPEAPAPGDGTTAEPAPEEGEIGPDTPIDLSPPRQQIAAFEPLPNQLGRAKALADDTYFEGVGTPEAWIDSGVVSVRFERDGTADPSEIVLANQDGDDLLLEVLPLADAVRIRDASP